jgi:signal peptidase I
MFATLALFSISLSVTFMVIALDIFKQIPPDKNVLRVATGSMCVPYGESCIGRLDPSEPTLHVDDLIVIEAVNPEDLNADYPNSDIITFSRPGGAIDDLITHRIAAKEVVDGELFFYTKGDGNPVNKWPDPINENEYDPWGRVSADRIVGKVVYINFPILPMKITFIIFAVSSAPTGIGAAYLFYYLRSNTTKSQKNNKE